MKPEYEISVMDCLKHDDNQNGKLIPARMLKIRVPSDKRESGVDFFYCGHQETLGM